jgi:hypothetical protein
MLLSQFEQMFESQTGLKLASKYQVGREVRYLIKSPTGFILYHITLYEEDEDVWTCTHMTSQFQATDINYAFRALKSGKTLDECFRALKKEWIGL